MTADLISREVAKAAIRSKFPTLADRCEINVVLNELPAVDAIPVEWLRKWPKDLREGAYVRDILRDWQKEQEAR